MSAIQQLLTEHLDIWTAADAGPKSGRGRSAGNAASVYGIRKLRELILELAVRGKLVPQDAGDEPASELLKRMQGNIKTIPVDQHPFALPQGWEWIRFGDTLDFQGGGQPPKHAFSDTKLDGYVQLIQIRDLGERPQPVFIKKELAAKFCTPEDIMIGRYGASVGKVFWGKDGAYNVALVKIIDEYGIYYNRFLYEFFRCPHGQSFFSGISRSAQAGFNKSDIEGQLMPVCSHTEQHRIVAKIDELMALCDQLEAEHNNASEAHEKLVSQLLGTLIQSQRAENFSANWQRIAAHFETLFTTEASIDALKQTLLQLAVMGKLVPQDPNDEPASELLKRIRAEKAKLIAEGKIKKEKLLPPISDGEVPFSLPGGWDWVRAEWISTVIVDCPHSTPKFVDSGMLCVDTNSIKQGRLISHKIRYVDMETYNDRNRRLTPDAGDLVFAREGSVGESFVIPKGMRCCLGQRVMLFRPSHCINPEYFRLALTEPGSLSRLLELHKGIGARHVNVADMREAIIPLPPFSEQIKVVTKVDELINLCDQLKSHLTGVGQLQQKLADVVVGRAMD